jgi:hypothetical protein
MQQHAPFFRTINQRSFEIILIQDHGREENEKVNINFKLQVPALQNDAFQNDELFPFHHYNRTTQH